MKLKKKIRRNSRWGQVHFAEPPLVDAAHDIVVSVLPHQP